MLLVKTLFMRVFQFVFKCCGLSLTIIICVIIFAFQTVNRAIEYNYVKAGKNENNCQLFRLKKIC